MLRSLVGSINLLSFGSSGSNIYLVRGSENVLVDSGLVSDSFNIQKSLAGLGLKPSDIHKIIFTHGHADHIGGAILFPDAEKWMSLHDGRLVNDKADYFTMSSSFMQDFYPEIDFFYKPGQVFEIVDFVFKVIETPGHTKGSVCFYDEESGVLFSGDTLFNGAFGRFDLPSGSKRDLVESLRKLSGLNFKYLYPGHGDILEKNQVKNINYCLGKLGV